ncbi:hypothetical protein AXG93_4295s1400 [Marchantia polymorpha subsp. ruderalis]|uniref:Uncharacterized protein n=1 Tax=Marchantia polymorpha subsp. ruderalis TaxID=1480154 RepID=A0A176WD52_MARPO|nr:hypothetical protein AXG93_4295s1400 [Marchantia polymorpha subsp. ruderalis]
MSSTAEDDESVARSLARSSSSSSSSPRGRQGKGREREEEEEEEELAPACARARARLGSDEQEEEEAGDEQTQRVDDGLRRTKELVGSAGRDPIVRLIGEGQDFYRRTDRQTDRQTDD